MKQLFHFPDPELRLDDCPTLSIMLNLDPSSAYSEKDELQFQQLLKEAERLTAEESQGWKSQLQQVQNESRTLLTGLGSLHLFITENAISYYKLPINAVDKVVFGSGPHLKYVIQAFQFHQDSWILALERGRARLFSYHQRNLDEVTDKPWPIEMTDALGTELVGGQLSHGSFGSVGTDGEHSYHGHNETSAEKEIDQENFFRYVDGALAEVCEDQRPVILYALSENQAVFRDISKLSSLVEEGVESSATRLSDQELLEQVAEYQERIQEQKKQEFLRQFEETSPAYRIENNPSDLATAGYEGRIETLIIRDGFQQVGAIVEGRFEEGHGSFVKQLLQATLSGNGSVYILSEEDMPEGANLLARLRY